MAVILSEAFTGTNGNAWSGTNWTAILASNTGTVQIQSNAGRMTSQGAAYANCRARVSMSDAADIDIVVKLTMDSTSEQYHHIHWRTGTAWGGNGSNSEPSTGYGIEMYNDGTIDLNEYVATTRTTLGSAAHTGTAAAQWLRISSIGSAHKVKWWLDGSGEPGTWDIEVTDATHTTGRISLAHYNGAATTARYVNWDDLTIEELTGGTDATATPATIVATATLDGPTESAGQTTTPASIIATSSIDATTAQRSETSAPATIIAAVTIDAATASGDSNATPTPATIAVIAALDAATASGGTNATASPAEIIATAALDAVTASGTSNATPAPDAIIVPVSFEAATATGGSASTATPAAIIATAALDAVTPSAGWTVSVTEIVALASFDAPTASGESNATPAPNAIVAVVTVDAVTATGGSAGTASPATIEVLATVNTPAYTAGGAASPAALEVLVVLPAVFATGNGVFAPGSIVVVIRRQDRTLAVEATSRVVAVPARSRTLEATDAD